MEDTSLKKWTVTISLKMYLLIKLLSNLKIFIVYTYLTLKYMNLGFFVIYKNSLNFEFCSQNLYFLVLPLKRIVYYLTNISWEFEVHSLKNGWGDRFLVNF